MKKILGIALLIMTIVTVAACSSTPAEKMIISAVTPKATETAPETIECEEWTVTTSTAKPTTVTGIITSEETATPTATATASANASATVESMPTSETTHVVIEDEEYDIAYETEDASYDGPWPVEEEPQPTSSQLVWYERGTGDVVPIPEGTELDIIQQLDIAHGMIPFEY